MRAIVVAGFACALLAASASADNFTPDPQTTYLLDLDTPDQHMSEWRLDDVGTLDALRATVKINGLVAPSGDIKPGFLITFANGNDQASFYILGNWKTNNVAFFLNHSRGGKDAGDGGVYMSSLMPWFSVGKPFQLAIDWTPDGKLTATVSGYTKMDGKPGEESMSVQMAAPPKQVVINGTGGEIELNPLKLGRTSP